MQEVDNDLGYYFDVQFQIRPDAGTASWLGSRQVFLDPG